MKNKIHKHIALIIFSLLFISFIIIVFKINFGSYRSTIRLNWDFTIPSYEKEIYENYSSTGIHGDGIRYHIFLYNDIQKINQLFNWKEKSEIQNSIINASYEWLDYINVPQSMRPDYDKCKIWYHNQTAEGVGEIIIFFDEDTGYMYLLENLT